MQQLTSSYKGYEIYCILVKSLTDFVTKEYLWYYCSQCLFNKHLVTPSNQGLLGTGSIKLNIIKTVMY